MISGVPNEEALCPLQPVNRMLFSGFSSNLAVTPLTTFWVQSAMLIAGCRLNRNQNTLKAVSGVISESFRSTKHPFSFCSIYLLQIALCGS